MEWIHTALSSQWLGFISTIAGVVATVYAILAYHKDKKSGQPELHHQQQSPEQIEVEERSAHNPISPSTANPVYAEFRHQLLVYAAVLMQWGAAIGGAVVFIVLMNMAKKTGEEPSLAVIPIPLFAFVIWTYLRIWLKHNRGKYD